MTVSMHVRRFVSEAEVLRVAATLAEPGETLSIKAVARVMGFNGDVVNRHVRNLDKQGRWPYRVRHRTTNTVKPNPDQVSATALDRQISRDADVAQNIANKALPARHMRNDKRRIVAEPNVNHGLDPNEIDDPKLHGPFTPSFNPLWKQQHSGKQEPNDVACKRFLAEFKRIKRRQKQWA